MCPLRLILIVLSATLAGSFVIRNLSLSACSKVRRAFESGFWTYLDIASGRYLWRHLVSANSKPSS